MSDETKTKKPDFNVYHVKDLAQDKAHWTKIGAAWNHDDEEGLNIVLDCIPVDGRLTLRTPKQEDQAKAA